mmetsp:Transcript_9629/g.22487  ORF Transcript_9629/g.22487 Transcript_9629/m.22487 type:complete len:145 (-) Transcript_9629:25-459(-)
MCVCVCVLVCSCARKRSDMMNSPLLAALGYRCAFGMLQRRWGILRREFEIDTPRVGHIVKVCINANDLPVDPLDDDAALFTHGLDLMSDFAAEDDGDVAAVKGREVKLRLRLRNRLARKGIFRPIRGRLQGKRATASIAFGRSQ